MRAKVARRLLITGVSGALGSAVLEQLSKELSADIEIVVVVRSATAQQQFQLAGHRSLTWDLTDSNGVAAVIDELGVADKTICLHVAADVSWHHTYEQMRPVNIVGTKNVANIVRATSASATFIYVSSAFTSPHNWNYRNAYERTKAEGEQLLRDDYSDLNPVVFSCSLVVGRTDTGAISRFHGFYPLIYIIDFLRPPALVGLPANKIDIVPLDWVVSELTLMTQKALDGEVVEDVVASAGDRSQRLIDLIGITLVALNNCRIASGMSLLEVLPIIPPRRWHFLEKAMETWQVEGLPRATIKTVKHLMDSYEPYVTTDHVLPPKGISTPAPELSTYFDRVVDYWFYERPGSPKRPS